jgi:hypothetical protein
MDEIHHLGRAVAGETDDIGYRHRGHGLGRGSLACVASDPALLDRDSGDKLGATAVGLLGVAPISTTTTSITS